MLTTLLSLFAPADCVGCGGEGNVICKNCTTKLTAAKSECFRCYRPLVHATACLPCKEATGIASMFVAATYDGVVASAIKSYKFDHVRAAASDLARVLHSAVPALPTTVVVCHVPTATSRIRERGFDHAKLLAKEFAVLRGLEHSSLLAKKSQQRQVGSSRSQRFTNMQNEFETTGTHIRGMHVLLVDDVITTGATIVSAVASLRRAGASSVTVAVIAQKSLLATALPSTK